MAASHRFLALLFIMCFGSQAHAQDMFVRPTNQAAHPVDLGIAVKPAPVQQAAPPEPQQHAPAPQQQAPAPQQQLPQEQIPTPPPVQQVRPTPQPMPPPKPDGTVDIITVAETPVSIPPGSGPNLFSISLQPAAVGQLEVNDIYKSLGLNVQEIAANCVYETLVILSIGESGAALSMGQITKAQQRFSGNLTGVDVIPTIACKKIRPPVSGTIIEQGQYYKIGAANVSCPPPHGGTVSLSFRFLGNGKGECRYQ